MKILLEQEVIENEEFSLDDLEIESFVTSPPRMNDFETFAMGSDGAGNTCTEGTYGCCAS